MEKNTKLKKWLLYTYLIIVAMLTSTSCITDNDDLPDCPPQPEKKDAPVVTAGLYCNNKLIAWETGSSIGVYLIDNEKECLLQDSVGAPYVLNDIEKGLFLPQWGIGNQVLERPAAGISYDATGIYPYGISLENTKSITLSVADQSDQAKLDLFTPKRIHGITADTDTIHLDFYRRMSRLLFNLTLTEVKPDQSEVEADAKLAGATILIKGLPAQGTFTFEKNELETGDPQPFQAYMAEDGKQGQAIVFPSASVKDVRFQVSLPQYPDTLYSFILDEAMILEACKSYTLELPIKYVYQPEIKHYNVKYRYEGKANKENVTVTRGENLTAWGEGDIISLEENSDFTFQYQSSLKVSVRTEDGQTLPMTSGQSYTFNRIQKDITIIIYAEEEDPGPGPGPTPEVTHKVTYRYEGEANASNVTVFKNGMSTNWAQSETIIVKDKEDFTFGFRSDMVVSVRTKDGGSLSIGSGTPYTFKEVDKDIEIIIYAETPEHAVKYVFEGTYTKENVTVEKKVSSFMDWMENNNVYVTEGNSFTFKPTSDYKVTVTVNGKPLDKNADGSYTIKDIYENKLIVISTNIHKVTYTFIGDANANNTTVTKEEDYLLNPWSEGESGKVFVDDGEDFIFQVSSDYEATVNRDNTDASKYSSESIDHRTNKHHLNGITGDIEVTINVNTSINLTEHTVQYKFINQATGDNTTVTQSSGTHWEEGQNGIEIVSHDGEFKFGAISPKPYKYNVTVTYYYTNVSGAGKQTLTPTTDGVYTIQHITNDVMVEISVITHKVNFTYANDPFVDKDNIPLIQGGSAWEENAKKEVGDSHDFTFKNNSEYKVTVTGYGDSFDVPAGESYTIRNVTQDINLVVTASICKVSYVLDEPTKAEWIDVKLASNSGAPWKGEEHKLIESGKEFKFYTAPKSNVQGVRVEYVQVKGSNITPQANVYSKTITEDTEFHIKAVKTHQISYEIKGDEKPSDFDVVKDDKNTSWIEGNEGKVTIDAGKDFTFGYIGSGLNKYTITVTKGNEMVTMDEDNKYTETNVQQDIHYVITLIKKPQVTVTTNGGDGIITNPGITGGYVDKGSNLEFTPEVDDKWEITVTVDGSPIAPDEKGKYTINDITKDTTIVITPHRKPADMPINADIHIWEELDPINGGIIYPKTK